MSQARPSLLNPKTLARGLVLIATLVAIGFLFRQMDIKSALDTQWVDTQVRGKGLAGEALFVLVAGGLTAVGLPRQLVCFMGGYAFGFVEGLLWTTLAQMVGCVTSFYYARLMGRELLVLRFPDRIARVDAFLTRNALGMSLLLRLLPFGHNLATNLAAGVSGVAALPFFAGSALGYLPQTVVFCLLGSGIEVDPVLRIGGSIVLFVASAALGVWLYRRFRAARDLDAEVDGEKSGAEA